ncbi:MAG TPA: hypothetical protein VFW50_08810, partial [Streptosporangiaceae bacterium]|nr:hypothetical protein [Streptosporangiaceae bacterium]
MLLASMPYFESSPACWALSASTLSGSSLLAWLCSSRMLVLVDVHQCGAAGGRAGGPGSAGSRQRAMPALRGLAGGAGGIDVGVVDLLLA